MNLESEGDTIIDFDTVAQKMDLSN